MSDTKILDVVRPNWNCSLRLVLAGAVFAAAALYAQSYQDLYDFNCTLGCTPSGQLTQGLNGNLYGTTGSGGSNNLGTIFMVNPAGTGYTVLWNFDATTGAGGGGLTLATFDRNFYGTAGNSTLSTLFRFNPVTSALTVLHQFSSTEGGARQHEVSRARLKRRRQAMERPTA